MPYTLFDAAKCFALSVAVAPAFLLGGMSIYASAAVLTPEGATVFAELWEWFKVFAAICMALGIAWVPFALVREWLWPAVPELQNEYERDAP